MSSKGIMRCARRLGLVVVLVLGIPLASAQTPPAHAQDDLDVTMRVIADPNAKVPDEIVRRIPLPKPAQPAPASTKPADKPGDDGKAREPGAKPDPAAKPPDPGREFGQDVADDAKQRADDAKRAKPTPPGQDKPPGKPPDNPPGKPPSPPGKPPK